MHYYDSDVNYNDDLPIGLKLDLTNIESFCIPSLNHPYQIQDYKEGYLYTNDQEMDYFETEQIYYERSYFSQNHQNLLNCVCYDYPQNDVIEIESSESEEFSKDDPTSKFHCSVISSPIENKNSGKNEYDKKDINPENPLQNDSSECESDTKFHCSVINLSMENQNFNVGKKESDDLNPRIFHFKMYNREHKISKKKLLEKKKECIRKLSADGVFSSPPFPIYPTKKTLLKLFNYMEENNKNQKILAKELNVSQTLICNYFNIQKRADGSWLDLENKIKSLLKKK